MPNEPKFTLLTRVYRPGNEVHPLAIAAEEKTVEFHLTEANSEQVHRAARGQLMRTLDASAAYPREQSMPDTAQNLSGAALRKIADLLDSGKLIKSRVMGYTEETGRGHIHIVLDK